MDSSNESVRGRALLELPHLLQNCSITDAFRRCVLEDAEIATWGKLIIKETGRHAEVFQEGGYPGPRINFRWPLVTNSDELASSFVEQIGYLLGRAEPRPSEPMRKVASLLADRWQGLLQLFRSEQLLVSGTFSTTGIFQPIRALQWSRMDSAVDMQNGDFVSLANERPTILWSGLVLTRPAEIGRKENRAPNTSPSGRRKSAALASTAEAIQNLWSGKIPEGMSNKIRDQNINDWQRGRGFTVAGSKTIQRYVSSLK